MILRPLLLLVFGCLPFMGITQTKSLLERDLQKVAAQLTEEQLARLINYAEKLQEEPKEGHTSKKGLKKERPVVFWKNSKYDFGAIDKGTILFLPFKYVNTSKPAYSITGIKSSCGCVTVNLPEDALEKTESNTLTLHVDTQKLEGETHITIIVYDNSAPNGKSYLSINADIIPPVAARN